jgi:hypothetical protein
LGCEVSGDEARGANALARDAEQRGWIAEAERHKQLITRLDALINEATAG